MIDAWSYRCLRVLATEQDKAMKVLNQLGDDGWELVSVVPIERQHPSIGVSPAEFVLQFYLKQRR